MTLRSALVLAFVCLSMLYVGGAAGVLRLGLDRLLFPPIAASGTDQGDVALTVSNAAGDELKVRRHGRPLRGCVVFFPGQHGHLPSYERELFPRLAAAGVEVLALSYPGQGGAAGRGRLDTLPPLIGAALAKVERVCSPGRTVFLGRSLGAMLAAHAARRVRPAGLVLEGAAPTLSAAVHAYLRSRWYLAALDALPVRRLLPHDYSLSEALDGASALPVVIFQGTQDRQAPLSDLRAAGALPAHVRIVPIEGGTHSNAYLLGLDQMVASISGMLALPESTPAQASARFQEGVQP